MLTLFTFTVAMKESEKELKSISLANLNLNITIEGNLNYGYFDTYDDYIKQYNKYIDYINKIKELDGVLDVSYEKVTHNGYIMLTENLYDDEKFNTLWISDILFQTEPLKPSKTNKREIRKFLESYEFYENHEEYRNAKNSYLRKLIAIRYLLQYDAIRKLKLNYDEIKDEPNSNNMDHSISLAGVTNDNIANVANEDFDIVEGRNFTKEEIANNEKVIIVPVNSYYISKNNKEFVKLGDIVPISVHDTNDLIYTDYYKVIGLHNGGYKVREFRHKMMLFMPRYFYETVYITEGNAQNILNIVNEQREEKNLYLQNSMNTFGDFISLEPDDYFAIGDVTIRIKDTAKYYDIVKYIEGMLSDLNKESYYKYQYISNINQFADIAGIISSLSVIFTILIIMSFVTLISITIIIIVNELKKRYKETSIRLSLGESRKHIYKKYYFEYLFIAIISAAISIITSFSITKIVKETLIRYNELNVETNLVSRNRLYELYNIYLNDNNYILYLIIFVFWILLFTICFIIAKKLDKKRSIKEALMEE